MMPTEPTSRRLVGGLWHWVYRLNYASAGSGEETELAAPQTGRVRLLKWELTTAGSSATMRPTVRTKTGAWAGGGATDASHDVTRTTAAPDGADNLAVPYDTASGLLFVRPGFNDATEDAAGILTMVVVEGLG